MSRVRVLLVNSLALTLAILACSLPVGSADQTPASPIIEVTATPVIQPTVAQATTGPSSEELTITPASAATLSTSATLPPNCTLDSDFVADVTIPDRSPIKVNSVFVKTWRLRNSGSCPWNSAFQFVQISGGMLTATPNSVPLPDVAVGGEVDISVTLTLSASAPVGSEQVARFQIRAPDGHLFGTKPFVKILVVSSTSSGASISGTVWADHCSAASESPSEGCVPLSGGGYRADGLWNNGELTIGGVLVSLRLANCSASVMSTDVTTATGPQSGIYSFSGLAAGIYCVSIDALDATNVDILIPGNWTHPAGMINSAVATAIVTVNADQYLTNVDFGWDYQLD